jgi:hypothetical protein
MVYLLPEDGAITVSVGVDRSPAQAVSARSIFRTTLAQFQHGREFIFGKMLPDAKPATLPAGYSVGEAEAAFNELGLAMLDGLEDHAASNNPNLVAGHTYLGQFINHDITFDPTKGLPENEFTAEERERGRRPVLDLSCLYGTGPLTPSYRGLYEQAQPASLILGASTSSIADDSDFVRFCDLPRAGQFAPRPRWALIPDFRNDDILPLAQLHVAFMRFHNEVVNLLVARNEGGDDLFEAARKIVVQHYQWIVLDEFLRAMVLPSVYSRLGESGTTPFFRVDSFEELFLPKEFAVAAFRAGHSMVRNTYSWNRVFQSTKLQKLFNMTGRGHMDASHPSHTLQTRWVIDWRRFFDFSEYDGAPHQSLNRARRIDTALAFSLHHFPSFPGAHSPKSPSLAVLDLLKGDELKLPSGQDAAEALSVPALEAEQITDGSHREILIKHEFDKRTPLWYYILKEAEVQSSQHEGVGEGERLGPVGSIIVAETLYEVMRWSPYSILGEDNWRPREELCRVGGGGKFGMAELLTFALGDDVSPLGQ